MSICPQCGSAIKVVPAGVSKKTGRAYSAFESCSNRNCTWKPAKTTAAPAGAVRSEPSISVASEMLRELQEIKAILLLMNSKMPKMVQSEVKLKVAEEPSEELGPDEEIPF